MPIPRTRTKKVQDKDDPNSFKELTQRGRLDALKPRIWGCIRERLSNDYSSVKNLLQIRERPKDFYLDLNLKEYNTLKSNLNKKNVEKGSRSKGQQVRHRSNTLCHFRFFQMDQVLPQIKRIREEKILEKIQNEKKIHMEKIESHRKAIKKLEQLKAQKSDPPLEMEIITKQIQRYQDEGFNQQAEKEFDYFQSNYQREYLDRMILYSQNFKTKENQNTFQVRPDIFYSEVASMIYLKSGYRE